MAATSTSPSEHLIADYLHDLRVSAFWRNLPRAQTQALENKVRTDIDAALTAAGNRDEATVYGVLDRMGPASAFVSGIVDEPRSGVRGVLDRLLAPLQRLGYIYGWGIAEIGALILLIVGPFYLWWIGPVFGMLLVRVVADRWPHAATRRATNFVVALLAVQALTAVGLLLYGMLSGGFLGSQILTIFEAYNFGIGRATPLVPGVSAPLSLIDLLLILPAFVAGIGSGIYLALSPRQRARPIN